MTHSTNLSQLIMHRLTFIIACAFLIVPNHVNAMSPTQESETNLSELQDKWKAIDAKLAAKEKEIQSGEGDVKAAQTDFKSLVDEANEVIKQIETTATTALKSEPENQEIVRLLMGIMLNDAENKRVSKVLAMGDMLISHGINPEYFELASRADRLTIPAREIFDELLIRHAEAMKNDLPRVKLSTTKGDIVIELFENEAPNSVANFVSLVEAGYYSDMLFHRVVEGFMAQGGGFKLEGDTQVGGEGPGYGIECECFTPEKRLHFPGSISMAHRGKDTGGSQFFLTFERPAFLDGRHTCFGRVVEGMDVLDLLTRTHIGEELTASRREEPIPGVTKDKIIKAEVVRKRDHKYRPKKVGVEEEPEETAPKTKEMKATEKTTDEKSGDPNKSSEKEDDRAPAPKSEADKSEADKKSDSTTSKAKEPEDESKDGKDDDEKKEADDKEADDKGDQKKDDGN